MKNFWLFLESHYGESVELKYRMFCICSLLGTITALLGYIMCAVLLGVQHVVALATLLCFFGMLVLTMLGYKTRRYEGVILLMSCMLNFLVFPAAFLFSGGVYSAVPLFFVMGIFTAAPLLPSKKLLWLVSAQLVFYCTLIAVSLYLPGISYVKAPATQVPALLLSFVLVSFYIISATIMICKHYEDEHQKVQCLNDLLDKQSKSDPLTRVYNRRYLTEVLAQRISSPNAAFAVVMADLDNFKLVNDTYGHLFGDIVLRSFSQAMAEGIGEDGFVSRFGGEEFLLFTDITDRDEITARLESIKQSFFADMYRHDVHITFSAGALVYSGENTIVELLNKVDEYLYAAKEAGKDRVVWQ